MSVDYSDDIACTSILEHSYLLLLILFNLHNEFYNIVSRETETYEISCLFYSWVEVSSLKLYLAISPAISCYILLSSRSWVQVLPDEPSFAGKPNLKRPVRGEALPRVPGQQAMLLSSGSEGWDTPDEQVISLTSPTVHPTSPTVNTISPSPPPQYYIELIILILFLLISFLLSGMV